MELTGVQFLHTPVRELDYQQVVSSFYEGLYAFAYSLARNKDDACDLTQETFSRLLTKGSQIRDHAKVKPWLFTTLYRIFIGWKRREAHLPHIEIASVEDELPLITPEMVDQLENETVLEALFGMEDHHRLPLMLFYLENHSYREIAELLGISIGTVMSRLSRAKVLLRAALVAKAFDSEHKIISIHPVPQRSES